MSFAGGPARHSRRRPPVSSSARLNRAIPVLAVAAALAAACDSASPDAGGAPAHAAELRVCLGEKDPPRSLRTGGRAVGFDVDVARFAARALDQSLRIVWLPERLTDIESTDVDYRPILGGECDAQLSVPGADAVARFADRLALSAPYYGAAYEVIPAGAGLRWGAAYAGTVAVYSNAVAHIAVDAAGLSWTMQPNTAAIVRAVTDGSAAAGLIWGPDLAALDVDRDEAFEPPPVLRWNLHAVTRRGDPLLAELDGLLASAAFRARVRQLLDEHRIPVRGPFASVFTLSRLHALKDAL